MPHFTFYGYRYVKIQGIPDLKKEDFRGLAIYSDFQEIGFMKTDMRHPAAQGALLLPHIVQVLRIECVRIRQIHGRRREYLGEQFAVVKKEFYSATGRCCIKTQTALLLTLKYHLTENEELAKQQLLQLFS